MLRPSNTFVFIDVEPGSICFTPFRIPDSDTQPWFSAPGAMHAKGTALTFADGHAEWHNWDSPGNSWALASSGTPAVGAMWWTPRSPRPAAAGLPIYE